MLVTALTIGLPLTNSVTVFEVLSFLVGVVTVVPQIMMPFAADLAPPERRASAIAIVLSGLLLGVMFARVVAGVIANFVTWRIVFWLAVGLQSFTLLMFYFMLPDFPAKNTKLSYFGILYTMARFAVTEPVLIQGALINVAGSACFTNFWVSSISLQTLAFCILTKPTGNPDVPPRRSDIQLLDVSSPCPSARYHH